MSLMSLAVVVCLASRSPRSYSPYTAPMPSLSSPSRAGAWLCLPRLLTVVQAVMAKEPTGDLGRRLQQGGAGRLISGKNPEVWMVPLKS